MKRKHPPKPADPGRKPAEGEPARAALTPVNIRIGEGSGNLKARGKAFARKRGPAGLGGARAPDKPKGPRQPS